MSGASIEETVAHIMGEFKVHQFEVSFGVHWCFYN